MNRSIKSGHWFNVTSPEEHTNLKGYGSLTPKEYGFARVQIGNYSGPGRYMLLQYNQRCPRNCCYDDVNELLTPEEVASEAKKEIIKFTEILKEAGQKAYLIESLVEHDTEPNLDYKIPYAICMFEEEAQNAVDSLGYGYSYREMPIA